MRTIIVIILALILSVRANAQGFNKFYVAQKKEAYKRYDVEHKNNLQRQIRGWEIDIRMICGTNFGDPESLKFFGLNPSKSLSEKEYESVILDLAIKANKEVLIKRLTASLNFENPKVITDSILDKYILIGGSPADKLQLWLNKYDGHLNTNGQIVGKTSPEMKIILDSIESNASKRLPSIVFNALGELRGKFASAEELRLAIKEGSNKVITVADANFLWAQINDTVVFNAGMVRRSQVIFKKLGIYTRTLDDKFGRNTLESYRSLSDLLIKDLEIQVLANGYKQVMFIQDVSESKKSEAEIKRDARLWSDLQAAHGTNVRHIKYGSGGHEDHFMVIMMAMLKFQKGNNAIIVSTDELNYSKFSKEELRFIRIMAKIRNIDLFVKFNLSNGFVNINLQNATKMEALNKGASKSEKEFIKSIL